MAKRIPPEAFEFYLGQGAARSYQGVAGAFGVSKQAVVKLAQRERWQERIAHAEREAKRKAVEKVAESLEDMNTRHLKTLRVIQAKALEALRLMPLSTAMEAVRALDLSIAKERLIRGEPSDRHAVSVEEVIKREYANWLEPEEARNGNGRSEGAATQ